MRSLLAALAFAVLLTSCAHKPSSCFGWFGGQVCWNDPPPGGRECTAGSYAPPGAGEFAGYTAENYGGQCFTIPPNTPNTYWLYNGNQILSVKNLTGVTRYGYSSVNYGGSTQLWVSGQQASRLPWTPSSFR